MIRHSTSVEHEWRDATAAVSGAAVVVGAVIGAGCIAAGLVLSGAASAALISVGITMPGLLLQDSWRWAFFAGSRPVKAFVNDLVWALVMFPVFAILLVQDRASVGSLTLVWGVAASAAGAFGALQTGTGPRLNQAGRWWRRHRDLGPRFLGEFVAAQGSVQLAVIAVGAVGGLAVVGSIRAAQVLFGPLNVFSMGVSMVAIPEAVRALRRSTADLFANVRYLSSVLAGSALGWGLLLLLLPDRVGVVILGSSWDAASPLIIPAAIMRVIHGSSFGAVTGMRALAAARRSFWVRLATSPLFTAGGVIGALSGGALHAAWGIVVGSTVSTSIWWWQLRRAVKAHAAGPDRGTEGVPAEPEEFFAE
jgi:hypothetical protein